jgi:hypothetical protein
LKPNPITDFVITAHAAMELERRGLSEEMVRRVLANPEQGADVRVGRIVLQSRMDMGQPAKEYLMRLFVDIDRRPAEVVTAYRTSKISKYWRDEP